MTFGLSLSIWNPLSDLVVRSVEHHGVNPASERTFPPAEPMPLHEHPADRIGLHVVPEVGGKAEGAG